MLSAGHIVRLGSAGVNGGRTRVVGQFESNKFTISVTVHFYMPCTRRMSKIAQGVIADDAQALVIPVEKP